MTISCYFPPQSATVPYVERPRRTCVVLGSLSATLMVQDCTLAEVGGEAPEELGVESEDVIEEKLFVTA